MERHRKFHTQRRMSHGLQNNVVTYGYYQNSISVQQTLTGRGISQHTFIHVKTLSVACFFFCFFVFFGVFF